MTPQGSEAAKGGRGQEGGEKRKRREKRGERGERGKGEWADLREISKDKREWVETRADKGGGVILFTRDRLNEEAQGQVQDGETYGTMEEFREALGRGMGEEERCYQGAGGNNALEGKMGVTGEVGPGRGRGV